MRNYLIFSFIILSLSSCKDEKREVRRDEIEETVSTDLQLDHFNIWVKNPNMAKKRLTEAGFNAVPDSLSEVHKGQGTAGKYFNFLNGYLELIYVYDREELEENIKKNKDLDFVERANFEKNNALPFSLALKLKEYAVEKIPFDKVNYHQEWMNEKATIYSAKNSKTHLQEPSIFVVYPEIESERFENLSDLQNIPEEYAFARDFYKHPNGAKRITKLVITSTGLNLNTKTIKAVNEIPNLTVKNGAAHLMELYFDNTIQDKTVDLRPELPLIIHL